MFNLIRGGLRAGKANYIDEIAMVTTALCHRDLLREQRACEAAIKELNEKKIDAINNNISKFVDAYKKMKNINLTEVKNFDEIKMPEFSMQDYLDMEKQVEGVHDYLKNGVKTMLIGGIFGGMLLNYESKKNLNNAKMNLELSNVECEKMEAQKLELNLIRRSARQLNKVLRRVVRLSEEPLQEFVNLVNKKQDWKAYLDDEKQLVFHVVTMIQLLKGIADCTVLEEDGSISQNVQQMLEQKEIKKLL